ncbi:MAG: RNB domain-containing ribonuclease, partial [Desulfobacterales bacterium]|nr:RNB domain-containing ribonuclease [Desulfobacterales bacterium]
IIEILTSYYLFEKDSTDPSLAKAILSGAGVDRHDKLFGLFVKLGVWDQNENLDLIRFEIPASFSHDINARAKTLVSGHGITIEDTNRKDLTQLPVMTIDGEETLDYDDAMSIEKEGNDYRIGIHIVDVGHFVKKGDLFDREALSRVSSIYTPDRKISMLPTDLSENLCSLIAGQIRPAITISILLNAFAKVKDVDIFPSLIKVKHQLTYTEIDQMVKDDENIKTLHALAGHFRSFRLNSGAIQITLPEIGIVIDDDATIIINRYDRESPGRMMVAEMMILANWLMARFLTENDTPAIFRSQPPPKNRLIKDENGTLFEYCVQRKMLSRGILDHKPEHHSGLGLNAYITATSPIRKFFDLATQRQVRSVLGLEKSYTKDEIDYFIQLLEQPMRDIGRIQFMRKRYWILKYLEKKIGSVEEAIVLDKKRNNYVILLPEYMLECTMPLSGGVNLKPKDFIHVKIQHVNARNDVLSIYVG